MYSYSFPISFFTKVFLLLLGILLFQGGTAQLWAYKGLLFLFEDASQRTGVNFVTLGSDELLSSPLKPTVRPDTQLLEKNLHDRAWLCSKGRAEHRTSCCPLSIWPAGEQILHMWAQSQEQPPRSYCVFARTSQDNSDDWLVIHLPRIIFESSKIGKICTAEPLETLLRRVREQHHIFQFQDAQRQAVRRELSAFRLSYYQEVVAERRASSLDNESGGLVGINFCEALDNAPSSIPSSTSLGIEKGSQVLLSPFAYIIENYIPSDGCLPQVPSLPSTPAPLCAVVSAPDGLPSDPLCQASALPKPKMTLRDIGDLPFRIGRTARSFLAGEL